MPSTKKLNKETDQETLERIENGTSTANYERITEFFGDRGIKEENIIPRENVLTYKAWRGAGRQVRRRPEGVPSGQWGCKIYTVVEDGGKKFRKSTSVFHHDQTVKAGETEDLKASVKLFQPWIDAADHDAPPPKRRGKSTGTKSTGTTGVKKTAEPGASVAESLRSKATAMQKTIDSKFDSGISKQNPTARRMRIAEGMRDDGRRLQKTQAGLRAIANAIDADALPESLWTVRHKSTVTDILGGWDDNDQRKTALEALMENQGTGTGTFKEDPTKKRIREIEESLVSRQPAGFFPTPQSLAKRMVELADLKVGHEIAEPSAGKGDIAQAIWQFGADNGFNVDLTCVETDRELCELLELKGFTVYNADWLEVEGQLDRIVMNPPYEKCIDIDHFNHAVSLLKPDGVVVALIGEGAFFRTGAKEKEFQLQLALWRNSGQLVHEEKLADAFNGNDAFRRTGVACRLIAVAL